MYMSRGPRICQKCAHVSTTPRKCFDCPKGCNVVSYCSQECACADWKEHKELCEMSDNHNDIRYWNAKHSYQLYDIVTFTMDRYPHFDNTKHIVVMEFRRVVNGYDLVSSTISTRSTTMTNISTRYMRMFPDRKTRFFSMTIFHGWGDTITSCTARLNRATNVPLESYMNMFIHDTFLM